VLYAVLPRKKLKTVIAKVETLNPNAFYSVEQVRAVSGGTYPLNPGGDALLRRIFRPARKGK
jgi:uncharacterized membrane-anchored protein YitT (DUF2179 family)